LATLETSDGKRACLFDDQCPYGAFCDQLTASCSPGCSKEGASCPSGETCDCYGRCKAAGALPVRPKTRLPHLSVDPPGLTIAGEADANWQRTVEIALETSDDDLLTGSGDVRTFKAPVTIKAGSRLLIACDASATTPSFVSECTLKNGLNDAWSFRKAGRTWYSRQTIRVKQSTSSTTSDSQDWAVRLGSPLASPSDVILAVSLNPTQLAAPTWVESPMFSQRILYEGNVTIRSPASKAHLLSGYLPSPLQVPVLAAIAPDCSMGGACLTIHDPTRLLSPQETLVLPLTTSTNVRWIVPTEKTEIIGAVPATFTAPVLSLQNVTGRINGEGTILVHLDSNQSTTQAYEIKYELSPLRGATKCDSSTPCASGSTCIQGTCTQPACTADAACGSGRMCASGICTEARAEESTSVYPSLQATSVASWITSSNTLLKNVASAHAHVSGKFSTFWFSDLYDRHSGVATQGGPATYYLLDPGVLNEVAQSADFKQAACEDGFRSYLEGVQSALSSHGATDVTVTGGVTSGPYAVCNPNNLPGGTYLPCIRRQPQIYQPNDLETLYLNGTIQQNGFCESLVENARHAAGNLAPGTVPDDCIPAANGNQLTFETPAFGQYESHDIWFCPAWTDVFAAPATGRTRIDRMLAFQQDVAGVGSILRSSALALQPFCGAESVTASSGDATLCGSGAPMGGVTLLSALDRQNGSKTAAGLLDACVTDLKRRAGDYSRRQYAVGDALATQDLAYHFSPGDCFGPAQFYGALAQAAAEASVHPSDLGIHRLRLRLLQQWVEMHSFVAQQGVEVERLARVDAASSRISSQAGTSVTTSPASSNELLRRMEESWALIIQEAAGSRTFGAPAAALRAPDYRPAAVRADNSSARQQLFVGTPLADADYEQQFGLAPALMEGLVSHMKLLSSYLESVALQSYQDSPSVTGTREAREAMHRFGAAMRYALAIEEISTLLKSAAFGTSTACTAATEATDCAQYDPPHCVEDENTCAESKWVARWHEARGAFLEARAAALTAAVSLRAGRNPLGIDENDLPLFFGDVSGSTSRFFASSDYLMNTWAVSAVASAQGALSEARDAWVRQRDSKIRDQENVNDRSRRLEALTTQYGGALASACGLDASRSAAEVLQAFTSGELTVDTCFVDFTREECRVPKAPPDPSVAANTVLNQCEENLEKDTEEIAKFKEDICYRFFEKDPDNRGNVQFRPASPAEAGNTVECSGSYIDLTKPDKPWTSCKTHDCGFLDLSTCGEPISRRMCDYKKYLEQKSFVTRKTLPANQTARDYCVATTDLTPRRNIETVPYPLDCYRGEIGAALTKMVASSEDVQRAGIDWEDLQTRYALKGGLCAKLAGGPEDIAAAIHELNEELENLESIRRMEQRSDLFIGAIGKAGAAGASAASVGGPYAGVIVAAAVLTASLTQAYFQDEINAINDAMNKAAREHNQFFQLLDAHEKGYECLIEMEQMRVGFDQIRNTIQRQMTEAAIGAQAFIGEGERAKRLLEDASAALSRENGRTVGSYSFHYWYDEKVQRFTREFAWAKRLTYLSLRAIEYEFQQSFPLRSSILRATHPDELETALRQMQTELATRTIGRRRPAEGTLVTSLRDDILAIPDRLDATNGERAMSAALTFRSRLWDARYAIRDTNGRWIGQGVPFTLAPHGTLENRCAERLWRVTATMQGEGLAETQPGASVRILKKNTFSSQWCGDRGQGTGASMQLGAVQPSRNLFRGDQSSHVGSAETFSQAALFPWFNVPRDELYKDDYRDGASEELAGRGLYGEYILLFPRELLEGARSTEPEAGMTGDGPSIDAFPLSRVEDVLIRFDYLSVDNLPAVEN
jgi:hypothetical protein